MGMTVLYIAFGFVALWLLAEVLMQYKARLRWRLLAFAGFLGVVAGVVLPSVLVIGVGAAAFAVGQTLVTLSFRKGFEAGWALRRGGEPVRQNRRRRAGGPRPAPVLEVTGLEYGSQAPDGDGSDADERDQQPQFQAAAAEDVYSPQPLPDDTGSYGIQSFAPTAGTGETAGFASPYTTAEQDAHQYAAYYDPQSQSQGAGYDYTTGYPAGEQQVYAAYSDPYIGTGGAVSPQQPANYDDYAAYTAYTASSYTDYTPDPYATPAGQQQYSMDTPPGGVWVPHQRDVAQPYPGEEQGQYPQQQPQGYPYQGGTGEYEQYRY
ncbi:MULTISPECIES: hypothetical protein [unclassified Streptomyces]|uniref:hypothetical protein n=1 Tax=unclassified Streptomyces TaxID=2593676 RepID=UPI001BEAAABB|nr:MULTISPECIES: hypothetical protein [unclassified Streptomyces]MBT2405930.1 hypothetical protein [Streptomyces sp. ISL-21]MBT2453952.1 hypothetical protein [Streptomyces sp. ISL-86]MBT2608526.1 hypothetical protein [Streptomyces sp. ISL-87]